MAAGKAGRRRSPGVADLLVTLHGDYTIQSGAAMWASLSGEQEDRPTALFCFSDKMAIGAMAGSREHSLVCPDDISIIGFDDIRYARFMDPPLTTIRQPMDAMGKEAVRILLAILGGDVARQWVTLPHDLVARSSTGPAPRR
ncbi:LacI family DNA-binding transcriptional regulator [Sphingomonas sp. MMS24-JH45]